MTGAGEPRWKTRDQWGMEVLLGFFLLLVLVGGVTTLWAVVSPDRCVPSGITLGTPDGPESERTPRPQLCASPVDVQALVEEQAGQPVVPGLPAGVTVSDPSVRVEVPVEDRMRRLAHATPDLMATGLAVAILYYLFRIVRTLRSGNPFVPANAGRLTAIGLLLAVGGTIVQVLATFMDRQLLEAAGVQDVLRFTFQLDFLPLWAGIFVLFFAEIFRRGAAMRAELDAVV